MAEAAKTRGRKAKGEGPVEIMFVDANNKEHSRVPANVHGLVIKAKSGKVQSFAISSLSPAIMAQMAADALKRKMSMHIGSGYDAAKDNVISLAVEAFENVKTGKLYVRAEGGKGGPGRSFDVAYWVAVTARAAKLLNDNDPKKHKIPAKSQLEALAAKLTAANTQGRDDWKKKNIKNPVFNLAKKQIDAEKAGAAAKGSTEEALSFDL